MQRCIEIAIADLESLVDKARFISNAGPDPQHGSEIPDRPTNGESRDPVVLEEDGQPFYLESCVIIA